MFLCFANVPLYEKKIETLVFIESMFMSELRIQLVIIGTRRIKYELCNYSGRGNWF